MQDYANNADNTGGLLTVEKEIDIVDRPSLNRVLRSEISRRETLFYGRMTALNPAPTDHR